MQVWNALTIDATALAEKVTIDAQSQSRVFNIDDAAMEDERFDVTLAGLVLSSGNVTTSDGEGRGGGIRFLRTENSQSIKLLLQETKLFGAAEYTLIVVHY